MEHANLSKTLLHGADLRETRFGFSALGHAGGDPELELIYDPVVSGARADDSTEWPARFHPRGSPAVYDGSDVLLLKDQPVTIPADGGRHVNSWGATDRVRPKLSRQEGHVDAVFSWCANLKTKTGDRVLVSGDVLLGANLRLLVGQRVRLDGEWWVIGDAVQRDGVLVIERDGQSLRLQVDEVFDANVDRWWWHVDAH